MKEREVNQEETPPGAGSGADEALGDAALTDEEQAAQAGTAAADVAGAADEPAGAGREASDRALRESEERLLRLAAEFDNFRKRVARERVELTDRAQAALVLRLLDVLDDLDRLAEQDLSQSDSDVLHEALVLVDRKLRKELEAAGLERIDPTGERFNPELHEAVSVLPPPSPEQDDQVSAVFQAGYQFKGTLVRPARVQVYAGDGQA
jgi:molecular chaperone GrpE